MKKIVLVFVAGVCSGCSFDSGNSQTPATMTLNTSQTGQAAIKPIIGVTYNGGTPDDLTMELQNVGTVLFDMSDYQHPDSALLRRYPASFPRLGTGYVATTATASGYAVAYYKTRAVPEPEVSVLIGGDMSTAPASASVLAGAAFTGFYMGHESAAGPFGQIQQHTIIGDVFLEIDSAGTGLEGGYLVTNREAVISGAPSSDRDDIINEAAPITGQFTFEDVPIYTEVSGLPDDINRVDGSMSGGFFEFDGSGQGQIVGGLILQGDFPAGPNGIGCVTADMSANQGACLMEAGVFVAEN